MGESRQANHCDTAQSRGFMQAIEVLLQRYSGRVLQAPAPDEGALSVLIESALTAPDHGKLRPWRFIVIQGEGRARLGNLLAEYTLRMRPTATPEALERERQKALRAPMIIVVAAITNPTARIPVIEQILSAGAAAQNILLAAFALGFNAVWKTGDAAYDPAVKIALGLESKDAIVGFLYVGVEQPGSPPPVRPAATEFIRHWGV